MGEHKLRDTLPHLNLYHALNRTLEGRLAYVGPVCSLMQVGACVLAVYSATCVLACWGVAWRCAGGMEGRLGYKRFRVLPSKLEGVEGQRVVRSPLLQREAT